MPSRRQQRENATEKIYTDIADHLQDYKDFTYEQKLEYIENAFNNVNNLYGTLYRSHKPKDLKFGFVVGNNPNFGAFYSSNYHSVAYSLINAFNSKNPVSVYRTMFHEFRHVRQFSSPILRDLVKSSQFYGGSHEKGVISKLISKIFSDETVAYDVRWALSGGEIGADLSARNMLSKISKYGMLKQDVERAREIKFGFFKGHFSNLKPLTPEQKEELAQWKGTSLTNLFFQASKGKEWFFNKEDVCRVLKTSPLNRQEDGKVSFEDKVQFVNAIGRFGKETSQMKRHEGVNFFGNLVNKIYISFKTKERVFGEEKFARFDKNGNEREEYFAFDGVGQKNERNSEEQQEQNERAQEENQTILSQNDEVGEKENSQTNGENQFDNNQVNNQLDPNAQRDLEAFQKLENYSESAAIQEGSIMAPDVDVSE